MYLRNTYWMPTWSNAFRRYRRNWRRDRRRWTWRRRSRRHRWRHWRRRNRFIWLHSVFFTPSIVDFTTSATWEKRVAAFFRSRFEHVRSCLWSQPLFWIYWIQRDHGLAYASVMRVRRCLVIYKQTYNCHHLYILFAFPYQGATCIWKNMLLVELALVPRTLLHKCCTLCHWRRSRSMLAKLNELWQWHWTYRLEQVYTEIYNQYLQLTHFVFYSRVD